MKQFTVPSAKIGLILSFIKRIVRSEYTRSCVYIYFTSQGIHTKVNTFRIFVPVPLDLGSDGFIATAAGLEMLLKSEGEVVFSLGSGGVVRKLRDGEIATTVTYTERGITKQMYAVLSTDTLPEYYELPEETIESSDFLKNLAICYPYLGREHVNCALDCFCFDGNNLVATDGSRMIVVKDVCVPVSVSKCRFLLCGDAALTLPKSGTCKLAKTGYPIASSTKTEKEETFLYIGLPDYHIWTTSVEEVYPKWKSIIPEQTKNTHKIHIDKRDAVACIDCIKSLPKDRHTQEITLHFEDGRLCVDSTSHTASNARLRFSEFTTGTMASGYKFDVSHFSEALRMSTELWFNSSVDGNVVYPLVFEFDKSQVFIHAKFLCENEQGVTSTVELKDRWIADKKTIAKKQTQQKSALFANADTEIIASLRLENEQLKKELELLKKEKGEVA